MSLSAVTGERKLAGLETLKCEVKELTHDEAIIVMVEKQYLDGMEAKIRETG